MRISDWSSDVCSSDLQVYFVGNPFEDPAANPDGLEHDLFDGRAAHCLLLHKRSGSWAGAVRLILPDAADPAHSFALQDVCSDPMILDAARFPVMQMGEVSRFCISKEFRRRQGDGLYPESEDPQDRKDERRVIPNMTLGLIEGLVRMSLDHGIFRSEEHTSELQSLMRISYAVFCLKKKNKNK